LAPTSTRAASTEEWTSRSRERAACAPPRPVTSPSPARCPRMASRSRSRSGSTERRSHISAGSGSSAASTLRKAIPLPTPAPPARRSTTCRTSISESGSATRRTSTLWVCFRRGPPPALLRHPRRRPHLLLNRSLHRPRVRPRRRVFLRLRPSHRLGLHHRHPRRWAPRPSRLSPRHPPQASRLRPRARVRWKAADGVPVWTHRRRRIANYLRIPEEGLQAGSAERSSRRHGLPNPLARGRRPIIDRRHRRPYRATVGSGVTSHAAMLVTARVRARVRRARRRSRGCAQTAPGRCQVRTSVRFRAVRSP
jgi:hypothetical protein